MDNIFLKYFPTLSEAQLTQYSQMAMLYSELNQKINVVSRKDIENIDMHHILYSLSIAKFILFQPHTQIIDLGTGGGFPGIPLAVMFPKVKFHLIDRIGKKIRVAEEVASGIGLTNVTFQHGDMGECHGKYDFVVSRAVTDQTTLIKICRKNISDFCFNAVPNGLITLKGGEVNDELGKYASLSEIVPVSNYFSENYFETKKIVYTQLV